MTSRKPLVPRNRDIGVTGDSGKPARRERYRFAVLNKTVLVEQVNMILGQMDQSMPRISLTEEDITNPTAFKISQVYYACFVEVFNTSPDLNTQPSFMVDHYPELMEDFTGKVQFFRLMRRLMENCAVPDFRLEDIVNPDGKRTCRILSAILNFIKFNVHMAREGQEQEEAMGQQMCEFAKVTHRNQEIKQKLTSLQQQKQEEQEHEEELGAIVAKQEDILQQRMEQEVTLQQHLHDVEEQVLKETQKKTILDSGLERFSQRIEDLRKQIVSSPDKLRARLVKLQQQVDEVKTGTQDSDALKRMWESLATRAQNIPNVLRGLDEDMELLIMKTNKASNLQSHFTEVIEERIGRQKQTLKEVSAKNQNLVRHLKFVAKEAQEVAYDDQQLLYSQPKSELERDVHQIQTQVNSIQVTDELLSQRRDEVLKELENLKAQHEERCQEAQVEMDSIALAVKSYVDECNKASVTLTL